MLFLLRHGTLTLNAKSITIFSNPGIREVNFFQEPITKLDMVALLVPSPLPINSAYIETEIEFRRV